MPHPWTARIRSAAVLLLVTTALQLSAFELTYALFSKTADGKIVEANYRQGTAHAQEGDGVKLYFQSDDCVYLYALIEDSDGNVAVVAPRAFSDCMADTLMKRGLYIPDSVSWLPPFEGAGKKMFHIVASARRLLPLERRIGDLRKIQKDDSRSGAAADARSAMIEEVRRLTIEASRLTHDVRKEIRTVAVTLKGDEHYRFRTETVRFDSLFIRTIILSSEEPQP